jgi:hypothetical protein
MGTNIGDKVKYKCSCDCNQMGCPGHVMRMDVSRTSDTIIFLKDGVEKYWFDETSGVQCNRLREHTPKRMAGTCRNLKRSEANDYAARVFRIIGWGFGG